MKCPKCGFVSYAGLDQCKKCSYPFVKSAPKGSSTFLTSSFPEGTDAEAPTLADPLLEPREASARLDTELPTQPPPIPEPASELTPTRQFFSSKDLSANDGLGADETPANWREELSDRVVTFRKRRARLQPDSDPGGNMELEFEDPGKSENTRSIFQPQEALENAERQNKESAETFEKNKKIIAEANIQASKILGDAKELAIKLKDEIVSKANEESNKNIERAKEQIESMKSTAIEQMRGDITDIALKAAEKILSKNLNRENQIELIDDFMKKIPKNNN